MVAFAFVPSFHRFFLVLLSLLFVSPVVALSINGKNGKKDLILKLSSSEMETLGRVLYRKYRLGECRSNLRATQERLAEAQITYDRLHKQGIEHYKSECRRKLLHVPRAGEMFVRPVGSKEQQAEQALKAAKEEAQNANAEDKRMNAAHDAHWDRIFAGGDSLGLNDVVPAASSTQERRGEEAGSGWLARLSAPFVGAGVGFLRMTGLDNCGRRSVPASPRSGSGHAAPKRRNSFCLRRSRNAGLGALRRSEDVDPDTLKMEEAQARRNQQNKKLQNARKGGYPDAILRTGDRVYISGLGGSLGESFDGQEGEVLDPTALGPGSRTPKDGSYAVLVKTGSFAGFKPFLERGNLTLLLPVDLAEMSEDDPMRIIALQNWERSRGLR